MTKTPVNKKQAFIKNFYLSTFCFVMLVCSALMAAGCETLKPRQQRLVSKPNMQFSGSLVFSYHDKLLTQIESGSASFTGGQSGNCGSCVSGGGQ